MGRSVAAIKGNTVRAVLIDKGADLLTDVGYGLFPGDLVPIVTRAFSGMKDAVR